MRWGRGKRNKLSPSLIVRLGTAEKGLKRLKCLVFELLLDFDVGAYGALHKRPHQNQALAQKLGILGEKVTSMTGLRMQKYLLGPI